MPMQRWDDFRILLAVARSGTLVSAGRHLGLDHTTVARRLSALEDAVGTRLIDRTPKGTALTLAGRKILDHATRIEKEIEQATASTAEVMGSVSGSVRLVTPEAFGTFFVAPNSGALRSRHPNLVLELVPEYRAVNLVNREADVVVCLNPPSKGRLVVRKLVDFRIGLYASREYLAKCGPINMVDDLHLHPFVGFIGELTKCPSFVFEMTLWRKLKRTFYAVLLLLNIMHLRMASELECCRYFTRSKTTSWNVFFTMTLKSGEATG